MSDVEDNDDVDTDEFFENNSLANFYKLYMIYVIAFFGYAWVFISAAQILASKNTSTTSAYAITIFSTVTSSFLLWGILTNDHVIVYGSLVALIGTLFLLFSIFIVDNVLGSNRAKLMKQ